MTPAQESLEDALKRCEVLRAVLRKSSSLQVRAVEERSLLKATGLAWFNNQRQEICKALDASLLSEIDSLYNQIITSSDRAGSRSSYLSKLRDLRAGLLNLRSTQILALARQATTDTPPNFGRLVSDSKMQSILQRRWKECVLCVHTDAPMAATVMMGGLLEGLLLARVNKETDKAPIFTASSAPRDKSGNPQPLKNWMLNDLIAVAHELGWISQSAKDVGAVLRDYRNYIHPQKELSHGIVLTLSDASVLWEVAKSISKQLL
jgi:hypothetical protein